MAPALGVLSYRADRRLVIMTWRARQTTAIFLLLVATNGLFGCASTQVDPAHFGVGQFVGDKWPTWAGGEASDTPAPAAAAPYPNVNEMPPSRPSQPLSSGQQTKAVADLDASLKHVGDKVKAAKASDQKLTAEAPANATRDQVIAGVAAPPN
jgi:hypothetical protein